MWDKDRRPTVSKQASGLSLLVALAILLVGVCAIPAVAGDIPFSFTINTPQGEDYVSGTFIVGAEQPDGFYTIVSIMNGTDNGSPITLLAPDTLHNNDNLLNPSGMPSYVTDLGFAFEVSTVDFSEGYTIYFDPADDEYLACSDEDFCTAEYTISDLSIPEPSSMSLIVPGVLGALAVVGRKRRV